MKPQIPILILLGFFLACNPQQKESTEFVHMQQKTPIQDSDYFFDAQQQALGTEIPQTTTQPKAQEHTGDSLHIIQKPITYNDKRKQLSIKYLRERHGLQVNTPTIQPKMIVVHYTGGGTLNSIFKYFDAVEIESARKLNQKQSKLNVSSHFLIDRDGAIYQLMPENMFARHVIGLNYCAIGIENIGSKEQSLTQAQADANLALIKHIHGKYNIEYLIGHSEYLAFRKSALWKETNPDYITYKEDPGDDFMARIRLQLKAYNFKSKP